jgi:hypothetical protein
MAAKQGSKSEVQVVVDADLFWASMAKGLHAAEQELPKTRDDQEDDAFDRARVAAAMQILAPEPAAVRLGLVKYLSAIPRIAATHALAKLALFSAEDEVRVAAINALKLRREKDFVLILMEGFHYPLPEVANRAADALVRLECATVVPRLVDLLDDTDPRFPANKEIDGKRITQVHELVRVNHHRNCMMCHAPAEPEIAKTGGGAGGGGSMPKLGLATRETITKQPKTTSQTNLVHGPTTHSAASWFVQGALAPTDLSLAAQVPLPNQRLPSISDGSYGSIRSPDIMVRFDVTYLRQDFSLMMPVRDAAPWPDMQRFDFLVRNRVLSPEEAEEYRQQAAKSMGLGPTPYQRAVLFALRELTQRDTAPTSKAWRELLGLPAKTAS